MFTPPPLRKPFPGTGGISKVSNRNKIARGCDKDVPKIKCIL